MHKLFNVDQITNKQNVSSTVAWLAVISKSQRAEVPYKQAIRLTFLATESFVYHNNLGEKLWLVLKQVETRAYQISTFCGDSLRPCFHLRFVLSEMTVIQVTPASSCQCCCCCCWSFSFSHILQLSFNKNKYARLELQQTVKDWMKR